MENRYAFPLRFGDRCDRHPHPGDSDRELCARARGRVFGEPFRPLFVHSVPDDLSGSGIVWAGAGDEDESGGADGLAISWRRSGSVRGADDVSGHDLFCGLGGRVSSEVSGGDAWWGFSRPYGTRLEFGNFSRR
jgi:hypothetical protein